MVNNLYKLKNPTLSYEVSVVALNIKKSNQNRHKFFDDAARVLRFYDYLAENELIA